MGPTVGLDATKAEVRGYCREARRRATYRRELADERDEHDRENAGNVANHLRLRGRRLSASLRASLHVQKDS